MEGVLGAEQAVTMDWNPLNEDPSVRPSCCAAPQGLTLCDAAAGSTTKVCSLDKAAVSSRATPASTTPCIGTLTPAQVAQLAARLSVCQAWQGGEGDLENAAYIRQVFSSSLAWDSTAKARPS